MDLRTNLARIWTNSFVNTCHSQCVNFQFVGHYLIIMLIIYTQHNAYNIRSSKELKDQLNILIDHLLIFVLVFHNITCSVKLKTQFTHYKYRISPTSRNVRRGVGRGHILCGCICINGFPHHPGIQMGTLDPLDNLK